jgi:CheY-like chemotaxis protein
LAFSGTDFDNYQPYLSVNPRIAYQSPVKTGDRWLTILIEEKPEVTLRKLKTRVIIMTAYPSTETAQDSFRPHAVDYLVKPLRHGDLINSIKEALQQ